MSKSAKTRKKHRLDTFEDAKREQNNDYMEALGYYLSDDRVKWGEKVAEIRRKTKESVEKHGKTLFEGEKQ